MQRTMHKRGEEESGGSRTEHAEDDLKIVVGSNHDGQN